MWGSKKDGVKLVRSGSVDTLITGNCDITGDVRFTGVLFFDGVLKGNLLADDDKALLTIGPNARVQGEVRVPNVVIHGKVMGNVYARAHVSMSAEARVEGSVYYHLIEMTMGAEVNGNLVHQPAVPKALEHKPTESKTPEHA